MIQGKIVKIIDMDSAVGDFLDSYELTIIVEKPTIEIPDEICKVDWKQRTQTN